MSQPSVFLWAITNSAEPDQTPQNAASDQCLHCLHTERSIEIGIKMKNTTQKPLKWKCTGLMDKIGKFHSF